MTHLSRRQLAEYAVDKLLSGMGITEIATQLAAVLKETHRSQEAELLVRDIAWELETRGKVANAYITSATPLSESLRSDLLSFIKNAAGVDRVSFEENIDRSVLGGVKVETAVHSWNKTVAKKLADIREAF
jgi:F0F1-type ATP synthase delta subunit